MVYYFDERTVLDERYYKGRLGNGMAVIVYPRKNAKNTIVSTSVKFGSGTSAFKLPGDSDVTYIPAGTAHFLEHLLFWNANGESYLNVFNKLNIESNGMTGKEYTYYIAEPEKTSEFKIAAKLLLDMVLNAEFSQANFETEKNVILQEAEEGNNSYNHLNKLIAKQAYDCHGNPEYYKGYYDSYGVEENDLEKITREFLLKCHDVFYRPRNMLFTVVGDVEPENVFEFLVKYFADKKFKALGDVSCVAMNLRDDEEGTIKSNVLGTADIHIAETGVLLKFNTREYYEHLSNPFERLTDKVTLDLVGTFCFGNNGTFNDFMCEKGYTQGNANFEFEISAAYRHLYVTYFSPVFCNKVASHIISFIKFANTRAFSNKKFLLAKKMLYADTLRKFDSESSLLEIILELYYMGIDLDDYIDYILDISKEEMKNALAYILENGTFYTLSVVGIEC